MNFHGRNENSHIELSDISISGSMVNGINLYLVLMIFYYYYQWTMI